MSVTQDILAEAESRAMNIIKAQLSGLGVNLANFNADLADLGISGGIQSLIEVMQRRGICPRDLL